ncbi:MAG: ATP-binding protein [Bacteroidetes bacterium]|nr:ATP-binding protein [Bacteroidota bacterium]
MSLKILSFIEELSNMQPPEDFSGLKGSIIDELRKINSEYDKLQFKYERSNKDKNILSSLLTRTSVDLMKVSDNLKIRAEELSTLLATIPAYVYFKDTSLNYMIVNRSFAELAGVASDQIIGKKIQEIFPGYFNHEYIKKEMEVLESGLAKYNIEEEMDLQDKKRWLNSNIAPIRNAENQIIGLIGISWDITERKLHEEQLRESKELAEAGTHAKNEFIASISHEFRTPMAGILGLSEILKNSALTPEQTDLLKGITTSAENLLVLLNDVLDFSAIEAGKMEMDYQPFLLDRVMEDISLVMKMKAAEKSIIFNILTDPGVPNLLIGDSQRLRQIIINLTNNAVKFTEKGKIDVLITRVDQSGNKANLKFEVVDTGIGIPPGSMDSLFRVFSRVRQDKSKLISGTGLGLSICKKLTDLMGGTIGVESMPGKGSTFWFTLPFTLSNLQKNKPDPPLPEETTGFTKKLVLVAEDNVINQRIVSFQLKKMGFEVDMVGDGQEAFEKYHTRVYDLIILDIQMPLMDGYQVAKAIREEEKGTIRHSAIIALTANAMKGDRELYLNAGMDEYVSKPFTYEILQKAISSVIG